MMAVCRWRPRFWVLSASALLASLLVGELIAGSGQQPAPGTSTGTQGAGAAQPTRADGANPGRPTPPSELYAKSCAGCHGTPTQPGRAGSLADDEWRFGGDDASVTQSITRGRPETEMPAFGGTYSDLQIRGLLVHIREMAATAKGKPTLVPDPNNRVVTSPRHKFRINVLAEGLETPWGLAFLPDGKLLVTERPGRLRIIDRGGLNAAPVRDTPTVWTRQDGGLFDVEVHPRYAENGWVYLSYAEPGAEGTSNTVIVRGRIREGRWTDQETLYKSSPADYSAANVHYGSRFIFDRDGYLYYSIGDRGRDADAQDLSRAAGKIHRVFDDGRVPPDNPFVKRDGALGSVWSYGHRNPQGLAFHPVTNDLWATEHGPRGGDELNRIERGRNYGWPVTTHGQAYGANGSAMTANEGMDGPLVWWTPTIGPAGVAFYRGEQFPAWSNSLLVTSLAGQALRRIDIDGQRVSAQEVLFNEFGRVRDVIVGPDGLVYLALNLPGQRLADTTPGTVVRLVPEQ